MTIDKPQPKVSQMLTTALNMQAANIQQKAMLDMMATKIVMTLKVQKGVLARGPKVYRGVAADLAEAMSEIGRILSMTRDECAEVRSAGVMVYPDERIQAIISKAVDDMTAILLEDVE